MEGLHVGGIVRCREREWVLLPSADEDLFLLRPLTGSESEVCGISRRLANLGLDRVEPAAFPLPGPQDASDAVGTELLWNAARLLLRDGAGPFRSLGRLTFRPRPYQFVPLLMGLRLQPVRLLLADDVGVGKTVEALLMARELLDRGEIQRLCVLCPPYLCEQWQKELWEKFRLDAVVVRSGTVHQLERQLPAGDHSVFGYYPHLVVSIDYAKAERHRANFLLHCPSCVIVDEAHGAAQPAGQARGQQQRHELLQQLAQNLWRHLILLTATPHSGVEDAFRSLLALLNPDFARFDLQRLSDTERDILARHFVQRRRADVERWLGEDTPFPQRLSQEETYTLSPSYRALFEQVYTFSRELVRSGEALRGWQQRIRYWTALALLRCVMSSPAAAVAALQRREQGLVVEEEIGDDAYAPYIYEPTDAETSDTQPAHVVHEGEADLGQSERRRLRAFADLAARLSGTDHDHKLLKCAEMVRTLLHEGHKPIVWCRYIATSGYVAMELQRRLEGEFPALRVLSVTGALAEDERRARVAELAQFPQRLLVATDCLSEGLNLQEAFTAVFHYDLPWNPNRLEQREGRVDRFGQPAKAVKTVLLYGQDNPVDGAMLDVLLRKARQIHRTLGITVPVPVDSETVMEAVLKTLFFHAPQTQQLSLFDAPIVRQVHQQWDAATARERESRTRFAQRAIKPDEVARELAETDAVLGDPNTVRRFVLNACQRLGAHLRPRRDGLYLLTAIDCLPAIVRATIPDVAEWLVTFTTPAPEQATYLGRNHPFVATLAQYLLEEALTRGGAACVSRCGVIRTQAIDRRTVLLLLRLRFTLAQPDQQPLLAEEVYVCGFRGYPPAPLEWLGDSEALDFLQNARPDADMAPAERSEWLEEAVAAWESLQLDLQRRVQQRARQLEEAHCRVRATVQLPRRGLSVTPHLPPDLLGALVLLPVPEGIRQ